ncbi:exonuclease domain-containing protein [Alicyclobacillus mengziensis]|uniref:Exonuclease domain-containing protein n=1 Tax=Alicyclobacillus mengziensis TaxID=2931921 RepID=A0A9X7VWK3_9BACL|nr:exonuclease domain-containing protein [Alicyclobacillus mengziensis]QSO46344.1 hypothetical protein JZ786_17860 [Alicyclobacillus mengziensis]
MAAKWDRAGAGASFELVHRHHGCATGFASAIYQLSQAGVQSSRGDVMVATKRSIGPTGQAAFIDVETTGLSPYNDEIVQLSVVRFRFCRETGEILETEANYTGFNEPTRGIPAGATQVHGISDKDVLGHRLDTVLIESVVQPAEFMIAHNAPFDRAFLISQFAWALEKPWKCSMRHVDWQARGHRSRSLQKLLLAHGITVARAHRADSDVDAALQLLNCDAGNGLRYFYEVMLHRPLVRPKAPIHSTAGLHASRQVSS